MPSNELERLKQDMQTRPELTAALMKLVRFTGTAQETADALEALGYHLSLDELRSLNPVEELDEDKLDKVVGAGARYHHFS